MPHPLAQHSGAPHPDGGPYSSHYMGGLSSSVPTSAAGWSAAYRMASSSGSPCLPHYIAHTSTPSSSHSMPGSYDLSDHHPPPARSPPATLSPSARMGNAPAQTSPQNLATTDNFLSSPSTSDCKFGNTEEQCAVKMEQHQQHHQQQPQPHPHHHHQHPQQHQQQHHLQLTSLPPPPPPPPSHHQPQFRCDPKFDSPTYGGDQHGPRYGLDGNQSFVSMPGPYAPHSASSAAVPSYQYSMSLHRQGMFNPIPAAVPSEQGWERYG